MAWKGESRERKALKSALIDQTVGGKQASGHEKEGNASAGGREVDLAGVAN
jgi:hypothetical protein